MKKKCYPALFHTALAIYSRSPSAFEAVRHLGILQLPSTASLQAFMAQHQHAPGSNEDQMALQHELYKQHAEKIAQAGKMVPKQDGVLIFDEVKVQGKVIWNSKNNQIIGLATTSEDLSSLQDIFREVDNEEKVKKTNYVLQFVWRDATSKFDVVGPYYTPVQMVLIPALLWLAFMMLCLSFLHITSTFVP